MKYFLPFFLLLTLSTTAQVNPQWVARYDGAGDFNDKVNCMTQDPSGNRYLGGYSMRAGNEKDFVVIKIDVNGDTLWTRSFDGPNHGSDEALDIAYDATGFVYATGYREGINTGHDLFLVKLNLNGDTSWTRSYNNITNQDEQGSAVATDGAGNVVVTGFTDLDPAPLTTNQDYLTIRYSPAGVQSFLVTYNGTNNTNDYSVDVVILASGNAVVTGKSKNNDDDFVTRCYNTTGTLVWTKTMDGGGGKDKAYQMAVDIGGNIIVTGQCNNGNDYDYGVVKYSAAGAELWRNFYDHGAGNDYPQGIAVDATGNIFITGKCDVDPLLPIANDIVTVAYNSAGVQQWATPYNGAGNGDDEGTSIATDPSGDVFITGTTDMNASSAIVDNDMVTIKYTPTGSQLWVQTSGNLLVNDDGVSILTDATGNCVSAGNEINTGTMKDFRYIKYTSLGNVTWTKKYAGLGDHTDLTKAMTADANGNSYMCGYTYSSSNKRDMCTIKVDAIGDTVWVKTINGTYNSMDEAVAIAVDASGNVYVTGFVKDTASGYNFCTVKYNSAGIVQWSTKYNNALANGTDKPTAMAINAAGDVYVTGESDVDPSSANNKDIVTIKYNSSGVQQWIMSYAGSGNLNDKPYALDLSPTGEVVVVGKVAINALDDDAVIMKYSTSGSLLWSFIYTCALGNDAALAVDQDGAGNVGVAMKRSNSSGNSDICYGHLDASGVDLGILSYNGTGNGNDVPFAIAYDISGNAYITGETDVDTTVGIANYDIITIKYNSGGAQQWLKKVAGPAGDDDHGVALAIDNSTGYVYVAAQIQNGTMAVKNNDFLILQYDPAGVQQLIGTYDATSKSDVPSGMFLQGGNLFVAGTSVGTNNNQKDMVMLVYSAFQVGIPVAENSNSLSVFPNPCSSYTEVHFESTSQDRIISLVDINGKVVLSHNCNGQMARIETSQFAKGVYFGTVLEEGKTVQHFKIVVE
jgi:uncharacterized delta-60 repeat protein